ncbi:MAG TPA: tripartite tricarboxylate transporter substrate binding protein [Burkholderiales bacterium]|nr:tripartite tricarboxylate transporter substrate binding protein [Burkholderiales bacterium]
MMRSLLPAVLVLAAASAVAADSYPNRPVRVIAAQSAGSSLDTIARIVMPKVGDALNQQFVIDNRGGAGGTIGVELAARAAPDGYTVLLGASSSMIISRYTYKNLAFDAEKDFDAVSNLVIADAVMVTHPSVPAKTVKELIALAKAQPGKLNMASAGVGSSSHTAGVMFASMAGIDTVHVPYKGGGPMAAAVVGGEAQWAISPAAALMGHIRSGRMRALAIASAQRSAILPELPTIAEEGVPGYEYNSWNGVFVPRGTPKGVVATLHRAIQQALADPDVKRLYAAQGLQPTGSESPAHFAKLFRSDALQIAKVVKIAGIKPE